MNGGGARSHQTAALFVVAGRKGAGKDTFYLRAREVLGRDYRVVRFAFIDPLKKFCKEVLGIDHEALYGPPEKRDLPTEFDWPRPNPYDRTGKMTAREVLQFVGTDLLRHQFDRSLWVKATIRTIQAAKFDVGVIADARYPEEVEAAKGIGAIAVRLLRDPSPFDAHQTEHALDSYPNDAFDYVVPGMPLNDYLNEVDRILAERLPDGAIRRSR